MMLENGGQVSCTDKKEEVTATSMLNRVEIFKRHMALLSSDGDDTDEEGGCPNMAELGGGAISKDERGLKWLTAKMSRLARYEAGRYPKESIKVCSVLLSLSFIRTMELLFICE